jgi:hypothetical protein
MSGWQKKVVVDVRAVIDLPVSYWSHRGDMEQKASLMENEARDLVDFIRDHRSRDHYYITIEREYQYKCQWCGDVTPHQDNYGCCDRSYQELEAIEFLTFCRNLYAEKPQP